MFPPLKHSSHLMTMTKKALNLAAGVIAVSLVSPTFALSPIQELDLGDLDVTRSLLISLDGVQPEIRADPIPFDLNGDGMPGSLWIPEVGAGYFTADHNQNGSIDDGGELIGALSGSPFDDLRAYDVNQDNWLDGQDDAFWELSIWQPADEDYSLASLEEIGIESIFLGTDYAATGEEVSPYESIDGTVGFLVSISPLSVVAVPPIAACKQTNVKGTCVDRVAKVGGRRCDVERANCTNNQGNPGKCESKTVETFAYCKCTGSLLSPIVDARLLALVGSAMVAMLAVIGLRSSGKAL